MHKSGRPTLVGTTSVERSEALAKLLDEDGALHPAMPLFAICTFPVRKPVVHVMDLSGSLEGGSCMCTCVVVFTAYSDSL